MKSTTATIAWLGFVFVLAACGIGSPQPSDGPDAGAGGAPGADAGDQSPPDGCGDGVCSEDESCENCPDDCGECADCNPGGDVEGVDYATQVQPIFDSRCAGCHGSNGGLSLGSYDTVVEGGSSGPGVEPCDCASSIIWQKISPNPPFGDRMPEGGPYLSDADQQLICDWINQGAGQTYDPAACGAAEPPPGDGECTVECGDGVCAGDESCETCPGDCGECQPGGDPEDTTPPQFAGLERVDEVSETACAVTFPPATDDVSPSGAIVYDVYAGPRDEVDLSEPVATLESADLSDDEGDLVGTVTLSSGARFDLIVRARDEAGNSDGNTEADDCDLR